MNCKNNEWITMSESANKYKVIYYKNVTATFL